jgi:hypothetical protein
MVIMINLKKLFLISSIFILSLLCFTPKVDAAFEPSTQFTPTSPEIVVTNAQRVANSLNTWTDGNMGFYRYNGENRVAAANGPATAITTSSGSTFLNSVITYSTTIASMKEAVNYASGGPIYNDTANNRLLMFYHAENNTSGGFWASIGMAVSTNGGANWTDLGRIIKPNIEISSPNNVSSVDVMGAPYMIKDGYFYVYFRDTLDTGIAGGSAVNLAVARASVADVINAANTGDVTAFQKYYGGSFSQPGLGGYSQNIAVGYPPIRWCDLIQLQQIGRYAIVFTTDSSGQYTMGIGTTEDGLGWYPAAQLGNFTTRELIYITASSDNYSNQRVVPASSNQFYIYRTNSVDTANRWADTYIEKIGVSFTGNPASPSSSTSATLAPTGREQVYLAIVAAAVISATIILVAFGLSRYNKPRQK